MVQHYARKRLDLSVPDDIGDMRVRIWKQLKHISVYWRDRLDNLIQLLHLEHIAEFYTYAEFIDHPALIDAIIFLLFS